MKTEACVKEMASSIYKKTKTDLMRTAKKMNHSIEKRIGKIQIGADADTFISFVLSDIFPDKFTDGEIVGFMDVSGYGDDLPDGQYGVKIYFDEKNLKKPSEFISVTTGEQYLFETNTKELKEPVGIKANESKIIKGSTCIQVCLILPSGTCLIQTVCF
nr:hypothetical protein [uncultured Desulfobacter sp.]